jgi:hypothetical protein
VDNDGEPLQLMPSRIGVLDSKAAVAAFNLEPDTFSGVVGEVPLDSGGFVYSHDACVLGCPYELSFRIAGGRQQLPLAKAKGSFVDP